MAIVQKVIVARAAVNNAFAYTLKPLVRSPSVGPCLHDCVLDAVGHGFKHGCDSLDAHAEVAVEDAMTVSLQALADKQERSAMILLSRACCKSVIDESLHTRARVWRGGLAQTHIWSEGRLIENGMRDSLLAG